MSFPSVGSFAPAFGHRKGKNLLLFIAFVDPLPPTNRRRNIALLLLGRAIHPQPQTTLLGVFLGEDWPTQTIIRATLAYAASCDVLIISLGFFFLILDDGHPMDTLFWRW